MNEVISHFRPSSTIKLVRKGSNILFQGEVPRSVYIVLDGVVRSYAITSSGEERIIALHARGDVLALSWALDQTNNSLFYFDALGDVRLLQIAKADFSLQLDKKQLLLREVLQLSVREYTSLLIRVTGLEQSRAIEKIGFTLYYLLFRYGVEVRPGHFLIDFKLSQTHIASLIGLTRESTTKTLQLLKAKNIFEVESSLYTINKEKLESFLGEDSFRDLVLQQ